MLSRAFHAGSTRSRLPAAKSAWPTYTATPTAFNFMPVQLDVLDGIFANGFETAPH